VVEKQVYQKVVQFFPFQVTAPILYITCAQFYITFGGTGIDSFFHCVFAWLTLTYANCCHANDSKKNILLTTTMMMAMNNKPTS